MGGMLKMKKMFMFAILGIFLLTILSQSVNAFEFDNVKQYNPETKTVEVKNSFLGVDWLSYGKVAEIQLLSDQKVYVIRGPDRKVAEFEIRNFENDYSNVFKQFEFYSLKSGFREINKEFTLKYAQPYNVTIEDFEDSCSELLLKNGSLSSNCERVKVGSHQETKYNWIPLDKTRKQKFPQGTLRVGIFTDVRANEHVEWIPTLFGVRIPEWAEWTEGLNDGLTLYYNMSSVVENRDGTGTYDLGVASGGGTFGTSNCKIGACLDLDGSSDAYEIDDTNDYLDLYAGVERTLNFWAYPTDYANYNVLLDKGASQSALYFQDDGTQRMQYAGVGNWLRVDGSPINAWVMITITWNSTDDLTMFHDGVKVDDYTNPTGFSNSATEFMIGNQRGQSSFWDGVIDEFGVWNRTLSQAEITQLYNSGDGITYQEFFNAEPNVTLYTPANETTYSTSPQTISFNCTAEDDVEIVNVTLFINGVANFTQAGDSSNFTELATDVPLGEGDWTWTCDAYDDEGDQGTTETRTITIDATNPVLNATNVTNILTQSLPTASIWGLNATDDHLDSCWYSSSENSTNTTVTCNTQVETNWTTEGAKTLTYCANDTLGNEACDSSSVYVYYFTATQLESQDPIGEGDSVIYTLWLNMTGIESYDETSANITLNSTTYTTASKFTGANWTRFVYTHQFNNVSGDSSGRLHHWNWTYSISNSTYELASATTQTSNTTVYQVAVDDCSVYPQQILNFTLYDEEYKSNTNPTTLANQSIETDVLIEKGSLSWAYSTTKTGTNNLRICVPANLLSNSEYSFGTVTRYKADDHVVEYHYLDNYNLTNSTNQHIALYDLWSTTSRSEYSTSFLVNYQDENYLPVESAVIDLWRYYVGSGEFLSVEHGKTDADGNTRLHLVTEDVRYKAIVRVNGEIEYTSPEFLALCQATPCQINLQKESDVTPVGNYSSVDNLAYTLSLDTDTRTVTLSYTTNDGSSSNLEMDVIQWDAYENNTVCSDSATSSGGTLSCTVPNTAKNVTYYVQITKDGDYLPTASFDLKPDAFVNFGYTGIFLVGILYLTLVLMAVSSGGIAIIVFGILGLIFAGMLQIFNIGGIIGTGSAIMWLIVAGVILIIKIANRRGG